MVDFHYCFVFFAYAKIEHWECNYLISNWRLSIEESVSCPIRRHFVSMWEEVSVPMIRLILERGGKRIHVKRINSMLHVWSGLGSRRVPTQHYGLMELMYLTLIQLLRSGQMND